MKHEESCDVRSLAVTYRTGHTVPSHSHGWAQLLYAKSGLLLVTAVDRVWMVPPTRAIWIRAGAEHSFAVKGQVAFRSLYFAPSRAATTDRETGVIEVSPLLSELILHVLSLGTLDPGFPAQDRLGAVLIDQISAARAMDTALPLPKSGPALRLAEYLQAWPGDDNSLPRLAARTGASLRTLQRRFAKDTGVTIEAWRQKARLVASTAALLEGRSVTLTALDCGYKSPSAYIAAFKRQYGSTPGQFLANPEIPRSG